MIRLAYPQNGLYLVLAVAFFLRLIYLYQAADTPLFEVLLIDSEFYDRRAREIIAGDWWGDRPFFMNPFYPYFLAILYSTGVTDYLLVGLVQAAMGVGSCAFIYGIGHRLWNEQVALLASVLAAIYAPYLFYDGALLTAAPISLLNIGALYCIVRSDQGRSHWTWAAGLLIGLSATARPMVLLFVVCFCVWILARERSTGLYRCGRLIVACGLVIGLVVLRNYMLGGELMLTTSSAGMNFYVGNHPGATGIYSQVEFLNSAEPDLEREAFIAEANRRSGEYLSPAQTSQFWLTEGVRFALAQPVDYLRLLGRKLYMFCNVVEAQNNLSIYFARDFIPLLRWLILDWGVLMPLALANWILDRHNHSALLDLYFAAYLLGCLLFFVSSEYRLPVVPVLCLYAARWLMAFADTIKRRQYPDAIKGGLLAICIALPVNYRDAQAGQLTLKRVDYYNFATLYQRKGDWIRAEQLYRQALQIDSSFAPARSGLANALAKRGTNVEAANGSVGFEAKRGLRLFNQGDYLAAIVAFERALERDGPQAQIYNNLGLCYYRTNRWAEAIDYFQLALNRDSLYVRPHYNLGLVHIKRRDDQQALKAFAKVLDIDSAHDKARYQQGAVLVRMGRTTEAEREWAILLAKNPSDLRLKAKIDSIMAKK